MNHCIFCKLLNDHTAKLVYEDDFTARHLWISPGMWMGIFS